MEYLLNALLNGDNVHDYVPKSRCEEILKKCCCGEVCSEFTPQSKLEALLVKLNEKIHNGGNAEEYIAQVLGGAY